MSAKPGHAERHNYHSFTVKTEMSLYIGTVANMVWNSPFFGYTISSDFPDILFSNPIVFQMNAKKRATGIFDHKRF